MSLAGVALGGGIGFAGSDLVARRSAKAARQLEAERREQQRKEDTYLALLAAVSRAHMVIDREEVTKELPLAGDDPSSATALNARLLAFASDEVQASAREWLGAVARFTQLQREILTLHNRPAGLTPQQESEQVAGRIDRLREARAEAQGSSRSLIAAVRAELTVEAGAAREKGS